MFECPKQKVDENESRSQACWDSEVQRECIKERLQKIAESEKGRKLERETYVWTVYQLWMRECDLKIPTEALICSAREQAIRTNYVKYHIDKC